MDIPIGTRVDVYGGMHHEFLGQGTYEGMFHLDAIGCDNPRIKLDTGETKWGVECFWQVAAGEASKPAQGPQQPSPISVHPVADIDCKRPRVMLKFDDKDHILDCDAAKALGVEIITCAAMATSASYMAGYILAGGCPLQELEAALIEFREFCEEKRMI